MAIALAQAHAKSTASTASLAATLGSNTTAGNFLLCGLVSDNAQVLSTLRNQAGTNLTLLGPSTTNTGRVWIGYLENIVAAATTVTATFTTANVCAIWVREFSGVATSSSIDGVAVSGTGNGATINTPSITPGTAGDLIYAVGYYAGSVTNSGSPWAALDSPSQIQNGEMDEYILSGTTSATAVNMVGSGANNWSALIAAFKAASSAFIAEDDSFKIPVGSPIDPIVSVWG